MDYLRLLNVMGVPCCCSNDRETDRPFPEPAMFLLNEDGLLHMSDYSNSPFCHPDIRILIEGG
jgi:hypothetical protein